MNGESGFIITFGGDAYAADEDATDLVAWLEDDERLRGRAETRMTPAAAGEMGGLADAAKIAVGAVGPLAKAVGTWLVDRVRNKGQVKLSVTREGGDSFAVEAGSVAEVEALLPQIQAFFARTAGETASGPAGVVALPGSVPAGGAAGSLGSGQAAGAAAAPSSAGNAPARSGPSGS